MRAALDAIEAGRYDEAARLLLARWRTGRQPAIAKVLDLASAKIQRPPIPGSSKAERHAEWLAIAQRSDAADIPRLLLVLLDETAAEKVQARIEVLTERGPDPRVAAALVEIVKARIAFVSKPKFWRAVLDGIAAMKDPRHVAALAKAIPEADPDHGWFIDLPSRLAAKLPGLVRQLENVDVAPVSRADAEHLAAIEKLLATRVTTEGALLDAVFENPADDDVRAVYADSLIARGDSRGELIVLQLKRARGEKVSATAEAKLVRAHRAAMLGPLAPVVFEPVFERGFLARCRVTVQPHQRKLLEHRWWRTVEQVTTNELSLVLRDDLPLLTRIYILDRGPLLKLLRGERPLPRVRALRLPFGFDPRAMGVSTSKMFPNLTCLEIDRHASHKHTTAADLEAVFAGALGAKLEEVIVHSDHYEFPLELDAWRAVPKQVRVGFELPYMTASYANDTLEVRLLGGGSANALRGRLSLVKRRPHVVVREAPPREKLDGLNA